MDKTAIYAGTFDPITLGHVSVVQRALRVFDRLIIALPINSEKSTLFPLETRIDMIKESLDAFNNVSVEVFDGYLVDFAKAKKINFLIRGIRNEMDFRYEYEMANINKKLNNSIDTVCFLTDESYANISSTNVKQLAMIGQDLSSMVPECVKKFLKYRKDVVL